MSPVARAGVTIGVVLGLVPLLAADDLTSASVAFFATILAFAVIPYLVFSRVERTWRRTPAIVLLAVLAAAHLVMTVVIYASLDEDPLNGIAFLTVPPLLAAAVGVVGIAVAVAARLR